MVAKVMRQNAIWLLGLLGLGILFFVQRQLEQKIWTSSILGGLLIGWIVWLWCLKQQPPTPDSWGRLQPQPLDPTLIRIILAVGAIVFGVMTWFSLSTRQTPFGGDVTDAFTFGPGNNIRLISVIGWVTAVILWLGAWWSWEPLRLPKANPLETRKSWLAFGLLSLITIAGGWLMTHRLQQTPYDMTQDHPWKLLDISYILNGSRPLFLPNNTGREPGQFYYIAALIKLFNLNLDFMALKIGNVIIGVITIPIVYLLAREIGGRKLGLIAAALFVMGKWTLAETRMGLRYPYAPLPAALILWHLLRYVRMGKRTDVLWVGFWFGIGLYGYISIRIMPLVITLFFLLMLLDRRRRGWKAFHVLGTHALMLFITTVLVFLPLGHFMVQYPEVFWFRVATRTTDTERSIAKTTCVDFYKKLGENYVKEHPNEANPYLNKPINGTICQIQIFAYNNLRMLKAFNWEGDETQVNAVSRDMMVDIITATLLLAFVPYLFWRLFLERSVRWWMLAFAMFFLAMSSTLSIAFFNENPSASRASIILPLLFVFAASPLALALDWIIRAAKQPRALRVHWALAAVLTFGMLGYALQQNYVRYFYDFDRQYRRFVPNSIEVANAILSFQQRGLDRNNAYILGFPYWLEGRTISVYMHDINWHRTHVIEPDKPIRYPNGKPMLYIVNKQDQKRLTELQKIFPNGELTKVDTEIPEKWFYTFFIP